LKALVLAAGYGTRLYPLTREVPKPLLGVGGVAIIDHILKKLCTLKELDRVLVVSNAKYFDKFSHWRNRLQATVPVAVLNNGSQTDEEKLGAVGDIAFSIGTSNIKDDLLVVAGDNLFDFDLAPFVRFAKSHGCTVGLIDLGTLEGVNKYSVVVLGKGDRIASFEEKPPMPATSLISVGVYFFPRQHLGRFDTYMKSGHKKDAPGYFIEWLLGQQEIYGYVFKGTWFDIGDIESYNKANDIYYAKQA
jgi:glucose-1-phosphate thymidylyltransferase